MDNQLASTPVRNRSIDIFRFIFATLATAAHSGFLQDVNETFFDAIIFVVLGRFLVQIFVCISGYYFFKALLSGKAPFKKQFSHMLKIYVVWTIIYYAASFVQSVLINKEPLGVFLVERVLFFFTKSSYPHFWNFPATLYPMLLLAIVHRLFGEKGVFGVAIFSIGLFLLGALGSSYYIFTENIPWLYAFFNWDGFHAFRSIVLIGLPFFSLGYLINRWERVFAKWSNRVCVVLLAITGAIYAAEGIFITLFLNGKLRPESQFATYAFVLMLLLTLLRYPMPHLAKLSEQARRLANFVYFIHPLLIQIMAVGTGILGLHISGTPAFFVIQLTAMLMGFILIRINTRWSNTLLGLPVPPKAPKARTPQ